MFHISINILPTLKIYVFHIYNAKIEINKFHIYIANVENQYVLHLYWQCWKSTCFTIVLPVPTLKKMFFLLHISIANVENQCVSHFYCQHWKSMCFTFLLPTFSSISFHFYCQYYFLETLKTVSIICTIVCSSIVNQYKNACLQKHGFKCRSIPSKVFPQCRFITFSDSGSCPITHIPLYHSSHFHNTIWHLPSFSVQKAK